MFIHLGLWGGDGTEEGFFGDGWVRAEKGDVLRGPRGPGETRKSLSPNRGRSSYSYNPLVPTSITLFTPSDTHSFDV